MKNLYLVLMLLLMAVSSFAGQSEAVEDTLYVGGKAVVFFGPSPVEYVSMSDKEKDEIDHMLYDFYHYREKVIPFLELYNIQEFSTSHPKIQVQLEDNEKIIYYRKGFERVVGLIMTDGKHEPKIFLGAATDSDLISMFYEYFDLG